MLLPIERELQYWGNWYPFFLTYCSLCLVFALTSILLANQDKPKECLQNSFALILKNVATSCGNGKFLNLALAAIIITTYKEMPSNWLLVLLLYCLFSITVSSVGEQFQKLLSNFAKKPIDIGIIFGVQSENTFLIKLHNGQSIKRFDFVGFRDSFEGNEQTRFGFVIDNYYLDEQKWVKVLATPEVQVACSNNNSNNKFEQNSVYKISLNETPEFLSRYVGIVSKGTNINKIKFEYSFRVPITEGSLVEININTDQKIIYQVVQGIADIEQLESKNEAGLIVGEAIQLGCWNKTLQRFEKFGWVPKINAPLYLANLNEAPTVEANEFIVGKVPNTNFPVIINKSNAVTHHCAILGVTGSGKSVFARNLIRQIANDGIKIICVDFTNEYQNKFSDLDPKPIIASDKARELFKAIDDKTKEQAKYLRDQREAFIETQNKTLNEGFAYSLKDFLLSDKKISIFELPDVSNTSTSLEFTKHFFDILFKLAKKHGNFGKKVCIVLEEAHTVIPETSFMGVSDYSSKALVNCIGQIALQGRKYEVGFIVIAQRTANVSKTILTQCNSIVAFQQFDNTSMDFLTNYMGSEMASAIPNLKQRQAIASGKAFKTNMPIIFEVPEITEPEATTITESQVSTITPSAVIIPLQTNPADNDSNQDTPSNAVNG